MQLLLQFALNEIPDTLKSWPQELLSEFGALGHSSSDIVMLDDVAKQANCERAEEVRLIAR